MFASMQVLTRTIRPLLGGATCPSSTLHERSCGSYRQAQDPTFPRQRSIRVSKSRFRSKEDENNDGVRTVRIRTHGTTAHTVSMQSNDSMDTLTCMNTTVRNLARCRKNQRWLPFSRRSGSYSRVAQICSNACLSVTAQSMMDGSFRSRIPLMHAAKVASFV